MCSVSQKIPPEGFLTFSPNGWEFLVQIYRPINVSVYARLQIFIQLPATLTKLCHSKCWVVALDMA